MLEFFPKSLTDQPTQFFEDINTGVCLLDHSALDEFFEEFRERGKNVFYDELVTNPEELFHSCLKHIRPVWINQTAVELFGAKDKPDFFKGIRQTILPESLEGVSRYLLASYEKQSECSIDNVFSTRDGEVLHIRTKSSFFEHAGQRFEVCSITDVTDIVTANQKIKDVQSRYEFALRETATGIWDWDIKNHQIVFDAEYNRILKYYDSELNHNQSLIHESIHPSDREQTEALIEDIRSGNREEYHNEHRLKDADGDYIWIRSKGRVCEWDQQGRPLRAIGTINNVSAQIRDRKFVKIERLIFKSSTSGIPIDTILNTVANRIENIYPEFRCAIHIFDETGQFIHECAAPSLGSEYAKLVIGFDVLNTCSACQKAVETKSFVVVPDFASDPAFDTVSSAFSTFDIRGCGSIPILSSSESALGTMCVYSRNPMNQSEVEQLGLERIARSLALVIEKDRQLARQSLMQTQVQNRQKFESLGQLAGGIAHDFNNLLLSIVCNAELIQMQSIKNSDSDQCADEIIRASTVAANICKQMLAFAGKAETTRREVNLQEIISEISTLVRSATTHTVKVEMECPEELPLISGDSSALSQVFINILTNAVDAIPPEDGRIQIKTGAADLDRDALDSMTLGNKISAGPFVFVSVCDNGPGFDSAIGDKVFDPFFTTKQSGRGLGLATVMGIVEQHGGAIEVLSEFGQGACFTLYFPELACTSIASDLRDETLKPILCAGKRILIVDDHQFIRQSLRKNFESEGCQIEVAEGGRPAIELMKEVNFDYVLLDQMMPGLNGLETYRRIREFNRKTPICFMTGYAANMEIEKTVNADPNAKQIRKPFQRQELLRLIAADCE